MKAGENWVDKEVKSPMSPARGDFIHHSLKNGSEQLCRLVVTLYPMVTLSP